MTYDDFNALCDTFPATTYSSQWGGAHVWKVGGKVFAIGGWQKGAPAFTFKVEAKAYEMLREVPGLRPAPYLASRGMSWIQHFDASGPPDDELEDLLRASYGLVAKGLPSKARIELGLMGP